MSFARYLIFFLALSAFAANVRLYLKDGEYQTVREYKVDGDRVHYYSVERGDWEDIPLELVDLKRTESEVTEQRTKIAEEAKIITAEDKAERERADEVAKVPQGPGVHLVVGNGIHTMKEVDSEIKTNKGRAILKVISPVPLISGKSLVQIKEAHSANKVVSSRPEFYICLKTEEPFGIIRLKPDKGFRIVEQVTKMPVTNEISEEPEHIEVFRQQVDNDLYKIWPTKPLEPGEYAVIEYTDGKLNISIWDFAYDPAAKQALDSAAAKP